MPIITQISAQTKNPDRANLFIDYEFRCGISKMVVINHRLKVGQEISDEDIETYIFESDKDKAFAYTLNYISKYAATKKQMVKKLYEKEYGKSVVDYVIDKCVSYGYLDDSEYARCYIEYNKEIKGAKKIKYELMNKGVSAEIIDELISQIPHNDGVYKLAERHARGQDINDLKYRNKLIRYLTGRGYSWSEISECISRLKSESEC